MGQSIISNILSSHRRPTERTKEAVECLFCLQEIILTCKVVMSGYDPDKHVFIDPGENIQDVYSQILDWYESLVNDPNVRDLPLTQFGGFALAERNIGLWNKFGSLDEELDLIRAYVPADSYVDNQELLMLAYRLRDMLREFKEYKEQELIRLNPKVKPLVTVAFDEERSAIVINDRIYDTPLQNAPLIFLRTLVERNGLVASYKVLADATGSTFSKEDAKRARSVQDIKNKYLRTKLNSLGVPATEVKLILESVLPVMRTGYKYVPKLP